jgi:hypothetical protein
MPIKASSAASYGGCEASCSIVVSLSVTLNRNWQLVSMPIAGHCVKAAFAADGADSEKREAPHESS